MRAHLVILLAVLGLAAPALGQADDDSAPPPPPLDDEGAPPAPAAAAPAEDPNGPTPADSAVGELTVQNGDVQATVSLLNPSMTAAPLWLWVRGTGPAGSEVRLCDTDDRVLWRTGLNALRARGELAVVPRPVALMGSAVRVVVADAAGTTKQRDLNAWHQKMAQVSLPYVVVGGSVADAWAEKLRARAPDRIIHTVPGTALPVAPAAYLGVSAVIIAPDAVLPAEQGRALTLFHCARGGVSALGPAALPAHGACPAPTPLLGEGGPPTAEALLQTLRTASVQLGILEERGTPGLWATAPTDGQAAAALLLARPPAQVGVLLLLACVIAMGACLHFMQKLRTTRALALIALVPVLAGAVVGMARFAWAGGLPTVRLVTVDARQGAPVALYRAVEVSRGPGAVPAGPTSWMSVLAPPADSAVRSGLTITEVMDVVDIPVALTAQPDAADPAAMSVRAAGGDTVRAWGCRNGGEATAPQRVSTAQGRMLLDRCAGQRGVLAPLQSAWVPGLSNLLAGGEGTGAWLHVFGGAP